MKFTFSWLKEHLDTKASVERIADTLTRIGLEVEELFDPATSFAPFRVAEVTKCEKHPNADKLSVCEVDTGKERLQVVCGAPNARAGMKGVFAPVGAYVPGIDLTLTKAKIRGVESHGMLLSERELELSDAHTGIIELDPKAKLGSPAAKALGLDDAVIEVAITPNRPDCLGVRGIARDLAAAGLGKLKQDNVRPVKGSFANPIPIELEFDKDSANACPVFAGRLVRDVKNGPSPEWLQRRLKAIGLRPINALVDITNYISYDRGRPLHVYDADKLNGAIRARLGRKGEKFLGLDGKTYEVDDDMCVIADDRAVLGLGGVIGGEETGVTAATTNVFIESAYFDPRRTARTGRRLGIQSDARFRFERGVDPDFVVPGLELATDLVLQICGGSPSKITVAGRPPKPNKPFKFDLALVKRLSGLDLGASEIKRQLAALGIALDGKGKQLKATPPSWRPDLTGPADLVEEVVRLTGVDAIPATPMTQVAGVARPVLTEAQKRQRLTRRVLAARGLVEAVTWSFIPPEHAELFGGGKAELTLSNPISTELAEMRPSLLPGLIAAAQRNRDRGFADGALFELGQAYRGAEPRISSWRWRAFASATRHLRARAVIGREKPLPPMCSPPRPTPSQRSQRLASTRRALPLRARRPHGFTPAARARSSSGPRRCLASSESSIPTFSPGSASTRRLPVSSLISTPFPPLGRKGKARRSKPRISSRSGAILPSCSTPRSPPERWCAPPGAPTARSSAMSACSTCSPGKACRRARSRSPSR